MSVDIADIVDRLEFHAPQHASKSQSVKETAVEVAIEQKINQTLWAKCNKLKEGAALLAAHILVLRDKTQQLGAAAQGAGPVESITEGELTVRWATSADADTDMNLAQTPFGTQFLELKESLPTTPVVDRVD